MAVEAHCPFSALAYHVCVIYLIFPHGSFLLMLELEGSAILCHKEVFTQQNDIYPRRLGCTTTLL